jgi:chlorophyllide a reductase subunit Z
MRWSLAAQQDLEQHLSRQPVLIRISEAKRLRDAAEQAARAAGLEEVSVDALGLSPQETRAPERQNAPADEVGA